MTMTNDLVQVLECSYQRLEAFKGSGDSVTLCEDVVGADSITLLLAIHALILEENSNPLEADRP